MSLDIVYYMLPNKQHPTCLLYIDQGSQPRYKSFKKLPEEVTEHRGNLTALSLTNLLIIPVPLPFAGLEYFLIYIDGGHFII